MVTSPDIDDADKQTKQFHLRLIIVSLTILFCFGILIWRLYYLQIHKYEELARQAETNRTAVVPIVPHRGEILDRNGQVLATNYKAYTIEITPSQTKKPIDELIEEIGQLIEINQRDKRRFKRLLQDSRSFDSIPLKSRLTDEEVATIAAQKYRFAGIDIKARLFRTYPMGETGAHIIGYIGRINTKEKEKIEDSDDAANYRGTTHIGKTGIEASYEKQLHGTTGVEQMETSAGGFAVRRLGSRPAEAGNSLHLSIDIELQKKIEELYGKRRGALVAIDPTNGEILALVSKPSYDPNLFVEGIDQDSWNELNTSLDKPLLHRAIRGTYPPGSTYKPFMALAALETGKRTQATTINDKGSWTFGGHTFRSGHALGPVNLHRSIVKSSNVYYYQLANDMGPNLIHDFMKPLGFGQITGIDLPGEGRGILPSTEWKKKAYKRANQQKWYAGETISLGIGQGYNNFTMLQLASATATLAAGGIKNTPHLVKKIQNNTDKQTQDVPPKEHINIGYKQENINAVKRGMMGVTQEGTSAKVMKGAPYLSGGKTGTAQAISIGQKSRYNAAKLAEHQRDHSLYIAFAPYDNPKIAVAAIVENAGFGAAAAAPIVRKTMDFWLEKSGVIKTEAQKQEIQKQEAKKQEKAPKKTAPQKTKSNQKN